MTPAGHCLVSTGRYSDGSARYPDSPLQDFVNEGLIRFVPPLGHSPKSGQHSRMDTDGNQLLGSPTSGTADTPGALQFKVGCFRNIGIVDAAIRNIPFVPSGLPAWH